MKRVAIGVCALAGLAATGAEAKDCEFDPIRLYHNQTAETRMTVKAGKRCQINFGSTDGAVHETVISHQAKVGQATTHNSRVIYVAKPGFAGTDEFTYARKGIDRYGNPSVMAAHIRVQVVP